MPYIEKLILTIVSCCSPTISKYTLFMALYPSTPFVWSVECKPIRENTALPPKYDTWYLYPRFKVGYL